MLHGKVYGLIMLTGERFAGRLDAEFLEAFLGNVFLPCSCFYLTPPKNSMPSTATGVELGPLAALPFPLHRKHHTIPQ
jgi:hypothetical protein